MLWGLLCLILGKLFFTNACQKPFSYFCRILKSIIIRFLYGLEEVKRILLKIIGTRYIYCLYWKDNFDVWSQCYWQSIYKPGSVPLWGVCHSSMHCVTTMLKRSTLRLGRATLKRRFTWTCSLQDTRPVHRCTTGGLLPHLLTLTSTGRGGYFLLRYSAFASSFLLGSGVLCAARTFLLYPLR